MATGDYLFYQKQYRDRSTQLSILAATDDQASFIAARSAAHQIFIQKINISITTYSAKTWTFKDTHATPVIVATLGIPAALATTLGDNGTTTYDFGPTGFGLSVGKDFSLDVSAAGAAGLITVMAYERLITPVAVATTN